MASGSKSGAPRLPFKPESKGYCVVFNRFLRECGNEAEATTKAAEFWSTLSKADKDRRNVEARKKYDAAHRPKAKPIETSQQKAEREAKKRETKKASNKQKRGRKTLKNKERLLRGRESEEDDYRDDESNWSPDDKIRIG